MLNQRLSFGNDHITKIISPCVLTVVFEGTSMCRSKRGLSSVSWSNNPVRPRNSWTWHHFCGLHPGSTSLRTANC